METLEKTHTTIIKTLSLLNEINILLGFLVATGVIVLIDPNLMIGNEIFQKESLVDRSLVEDMRQKLEVDLNNITSEYALKTIKFISKYYSINPNSDESKEIELSYYNEIIINNFHNKIKNIINSYVNITNKYYIENSNDEPSSTSSIIDIDNIDSCIIDDNTDCDEIDINTTISPLEKLPRTKNESTFEKIKRNLKTCKKFSLNLPNNNNTSQYCECNIPSKIDHSSYFTYCGNCGLINNIVNTYDNVYVDIENLVSGKTISTISISHIPSKHYKAWMSKILGTCDKKYNQDDIKRINDHIKEYGYNIDKINYNNIRDILRKLGMSNKYNKYITSILYDINSTRPPNLSYNDLAFHELIVNRIIKNYDDIFGDDGKNRPFYQFFIKEVFKLMFVNDDYKIGILDFIHTQSPITMNKNKDKWNVICDKDPEIMILINNYIKNSTKNL